MDLSAINLDAMGFDTSLATQAAGSLPLYVATFAVVKRWRAVPKRFEMLLAAGLTAVANVLVALGSGTPLFPALSACASGAWIAMIAHNFMVKNARSAAKEEAAPPPEKPENHV